MNRKAMRKRQQQECSRRRSLPTPDRTSLATAGAVVATTVFTGLTPAVTFASERAVPRLADTRTAVSSIADDILSARQLPDVFMQTRAHGRLFQNQRIAAATLSIAADTRVLSFNIAAGPLDTVVAQYEKVTGIKVTLAKAAIGGVQSPGVSGSMTPQRALDALLTGTSLRALDQAGGGIRLDVKGVSEDVAVEAEAPTLSSPKYTEHLINTPQTLVVIPQKVYQEQNANSLRDVLRNTPGITMSIGEGGSGGTSPGDNLLIRGFRATNDIFVDGVRNPGYSNRDTFNTESVEVAKGPSSVTASRGATGGSINLVSKQAGLQDVSSLRVSMGTADMKRTTLDVNRVLNSQVAVRLNGMWQDTGYPGRDVAQYKSWGLAPSIAVGLNSNTKVTLNYLRMEQNNIPDWGIPTLLPDVAINAGVTVNALDFHNFYGIASRDYETVNSDLASLIVEHKFSQTLHLRNVTRYGNDFRDAVLTPPRPATSATGQGPGDPGYDPTIAQIRRTDTKYQHRNDQIVSNQTDLTTDFKTFSFTHKADLGLELTQDKQPSYAFTDLFTAGRPPVDDLYHPTPYAAYTPVYGRTGASTDGRATTVGLYAFDTMKINKQWQLDMGLRWDQIDADYRSIAANGVESRFGRVDKAITGRGGIVYHPREGGNVYAAYSTAFNPSFDGTLGLTIAATGVSSQSLAPEMTQNIEVGTKWDFAHAYQVTAALFQMRKVNARSTDLTGATVLAGDQEVKGVEFGLSGNLTQRLYAFGGLSFMDGTVKESGTPSEVGVELAYVPKVQLNLWSTYRLWKELTVGGGVNYSDGNFFNNTGTFNFVAGGTTPQPKYATNAAAVQALTKYWIASAMVSYPVHRHVLLQLNLTNLTNEKYADRAYDRHFLPGPTRQIVFTPVITF